jgi:hypothetical protein
MSNDIPHRFRETSFRDYEPFIASIVQAYPNAVKAIPKLFNKAQVTFSCRLRDAIKSYKDNHWSSYIDRVRFDSIVDSIVVSERNDGSVLSGSKEGIERYLNIGTEVPRSFPLQSEQDESFVIDVSKPSKVLIAELSQAHKLSPRLLIQGLTSEEVDELESNYDIGINKNENGSFTLI